MGAWVPLLVRSEDFAEFATRVAELEDARVAADPALGKQLAGQVARIGPVLTEAAPGASSRPGVDLAAVVEVQLAQLVPWELGDLQQLARGDFETTRRWTRAMDVCTRHVGQFLSTEQVATEAGMAVSEWRDAPRKISRHLERHYAGVPGWPLRGVGGRTLGYDDGQAYWAINVDQATRWLEVRGEEILTDAQRELGSHGFRPPSVSQ